jgi:hypothetical protein
MCRPFRAEMWGDCQFPGLHPGLVCDALSALGQRTAAIEPAGGGGRPGTGTGTKPETL